MDTTTREQARYVTAEFARRVAARNAKPRGDGICPGHQGKTYAQVEFSARVFFFSLVALGLLLCIAAVWGAR